MNKIHFRDQRTDLPGALQGSQSRVAQRLVGQPTTLLQASAGARIARRAARRSWALSQRTPRAAHTEKVQPRVAWPVWTARRRRTPPSSSCWPGRSRRRDRCSTDPLHPPRLGRAGCTPPRRVGGGTTRAPHSSRLALWDKGWRAPPKVFRTAKP